MTSGRSKRRNFLLLVFIIKSISKKLLIKIIIITARNLSLGIHMEVDGMYVYITISQLGYCMYHLYIIHYSKLHYC